MNRTDDDICRVPDEIRNCSRCGSPSQGLHSCPYASEIRGEDDEEYCNCCEECASECRMDI